MYKFNSMTLAATLTLISESDHTLMRRVHRWHAPRWIRVWMVCATRGGDGWLWCAIGLATLWLGGNRRFAAIGAAALAAGMGIVAFLNLKKATGRKRPCALEPHCWASRPVLLRSQRGGVAHCAGHALPERRTAGAGLGTALAFGAVWVCAR